MIQIYSLFFLIESELFIKFAEKNMAHGKLVRQILDDIWEGFK